MGRFNMKGCKHLTRCLVADDLRCVDCGDAISTDMSGPGLARRGDRATSKAAANRGLGRKLNQRVIILGYFLDAGDDGLIHQEVGDFSDVADTAHRTRCSELEKSGYIEETDRVRATRSHAEATVWVITRRGERALEAWMGQQVA